jgi:hypothetical protein
LRTYSTTRSLLKVRRSDGFVLPRIMIQVVSHRRLQPSICIHRNTFGRLCQAGAQLAPPRPHGDARCGCCSSLVGTSGRGACAAPRPARARAGAGSAASPAAANANAAARQPRCVDNGGSCGRSVEIIYRFFGALAGARFFFGFRPRLLGIGKQWVGTDQVARG